VAVAAREAAKADAAEQALQAKQAKQASQAREAAKAAVSKAKHDPFANADSKLAKDLKPGVAYGASGVAWGLREQPALNFAWTDAGLQSNPMQYAPFGATGQSRTNPESLKLENEYWKLKSEGLARKAEALEMKSQELRKANGSRREAMEAEADAKLAAAEVKMCQVNARRIQDELDAAGIGELQSGSKGPRVSALQQVLNSKLEPSPELQADGDFGPLTEQAVKDFQKVKKLEVTGVVDDKTRKALGLSNNTFQARMFFNAPVAAPAATPLFPTPGPVAPVSPPATYSVPQKPVTAAPPKQAATIDDQLVKLKRQVDELQRAKQSLEDQLKEFESSRGR
jgi:murein L,D-transpeptidase YcbB/YkuD